MSNEVNTKLVEEAYERAQYLGIYFYIKEVDKLVVENDLEELRELLIHMKGIDRDYID